MIQSTVNHKNRHIHCKNTPTRRDVTFEGLIQLVLPKNHPKVVDGAGVELHPEDHISGWVSVPLVVALQLRRVRKGESGHET